MRSRVPRWTARVVLVVLVALVVAATCASAGASSYAPVDTPGPPLSVPVESLRSALACQPTVAHAATTPALLVPGTTVNPTEFTWNWEPALSHDGIPWCTIDLPGNGMGDIQTAGEYIVYAIRTMSALAGRKIDIVGHSQGGMVPRWALRFWPDTRAMVDDVVGLSPSNHGTVDANVICIPGCAPAIWQQRAGSNFYAALNSDDETFPGISYTSIYTNTDEVVVPNVGPQAASALRTGGGAITNVAIQQVCPLDLTEHLGIGTFDNTAYAIALDALTHTGPADLARVSRSACSNPLMPGTNPLSFIGGFARLGALVGETLLTYPHVPAEPPLACYVTASCPAAASSRRAAGRARTRARSHHRRRHVRRV